MVSGLQLLNKDGKKQVQGQVKQFLISGIQGWCFVLSSWGGGWGVERKQLSLSSNCFCQITEE